MNNIIEETYENNYQDLTIEELKEEIENVIGDYGVCNMEAEIAVKRDEVLEKNKAVIATLLDYEEFRKDLISLARINQSSPKKAYAKFKAMSVLAETEPYPNNKLCEILSLMFISVIVDKKRSKGTKELTIKGRTR